MHGLEMHGLQALDGGQKAARMIGILIARGMAACPQNGATRKNPLTRITVHITDQIQSKVKGWAALIRRLGSPKRA